MEQELVQQLFSERQAIDAEIQKLEKRRAAIDVLLGEEDVVNVITNKDMTTIEMARAILEEQGSPMGAAEIRKAIVQKFGRNPAPSLQQMLYGRAAKNKLVYNEGGKYGLLKWRS